MRIPKIHLALLFLTPLICTADHCAAAETSTADSVRQIDPQVLGPSAAEARQAVRQDARNRLRAANQRETANWRKLESLPDWERYRDERIAALRRSLGTLP